MEVNGSLVNFYRPRYRPKPVKRGKRGKRLQGVQLELFPDETLIPALPRTLPRDPQRPLADLFPDAY